MKTTEENNTLIAVFMDVDQVDIDTWLEDNKELKYHSSWGWLMPVVEKIEGLGYWVNRHDGDVYITNNNSDIIVPTPMSEGGKDMYYKAVVEFIKWYNENKEE